VPNRARGYGITPEGIRNAAPTLALEALSETEFRMLGPIHLQLRMLREDGDVSGLEVIRQGRAWPAEKL